MDEDGVVVVAIADISFEVYSSSMSLSLSYEEYPSLVNSTILDGLLFFLFLMNGLLLGTLESLLLSLGMSLPPRVSLFFF
jgi:hypothetical protein